MTYDLFGEIPVTAQDVRLWLKHLGLKPETRRSAWYVKAYDVVEKLKQAKLRGDWPP
ncbi:MAG: hypothetical protein IH605_01745 [Burkholderiales bacterium]|nr:hypothetical protein [Burkholderiales bacterium]